MPKQRNSIQPSKFPTSSGTGTYSDVADEYYDSERHPTCLNFRQASKLVLPFLLPKSQLADNWICEIGAGRSLIAEYLRSLDSPIDRVILTDSSSRMLRYSESFALCGAKLLVGDAQAIPLKEETCGLVLSFLGDPYNTTDFWSEVVRVLKPEGRALFTTPSHEWAVRFRRTQSPEHFQSAEFELADGRWLRLPSLIYPVEAQRQMIELSGLRVLEVREIRLGDLPRASISPKLLLDRGSNISVITAFSLEKLSLKC